MNFYDYIDAYESIKAEYSDPNYSLNNNNEKLDKNNNKKSLSWKSILFFSILFAFLIFGYYAYDTFLHFFPIHWLFKFMFAIAGLLAILFPFIIQKIKAGYNIDDVKNFMIKKYSRRPHYYQNLNSPIL